jgi:hypothetical protein
VVSPPDDDEDQNARDIEHEPEHCCAARKVHFGAIMPRRTALTVQASS